MTAEIFAEWLQRQGYRVARTASSFWYEAGPRVYQAFPYHWVIRPTEDELSSLLRERRIVALRYSTDVDSPSGCISYHAVYEGSTYTLETLERRSRQNVRAGLKNCQVEPMSLERLAEEGWLLEQDTVSRQGRQIAVDKEAWSRRYLSARDLPGFEAWGAFVEGRLVASLLGFQMEDCCELLSQQCHRDYLNARVNNALSFVVTQTLVERPANRSVFYALHSLDAPANIDEFKFRMGYVAKPVRQRVVFHPWLSPLANRLTHKFALQLLRRYPGNPLLAKGEGMLRFYLQGKQPLDNQDWPVCLEESKLDLAKV